MFACTLVHDIYDLFCMLRNGSAGTRALPRPRYRMRRLVSTKVRGQCDVVGGEMGGAYLSTFQIYRA